VIDVLAFPPDTARIAELRAARLQAAQPLECRGRVARFASLGLFLGWVADVGAAFAPVPGADRLVFGLASVVLAVLVVATHVLARELFARAARHRRDAERDFSAVRLIDAEPLLARASGDPVIGQYLRMVGRQARPLVGIELTALLRWQPAPAPGPAPRPAPVAAQRCDAVVA
jgi:hypothetical protein